MYSKKTQGWVKHADFIFLDILCLHVAFVLAYFTRNGFVNPYGNQWYVGLAIVYALVDFAVLVANRTMKNVLKRGFYKEIEQTVKHAFFVVVFVSLYMFSTQSGDIYSRILFYLLAIYYIVIAYVVRIIWKKMLLRRKKDFIGASMYFITTEKRAERVIKRFWKHNLNNSLPLGMCILDRDCIGQKIEGVEVNTNAESVVNYLCGKWVDEILVSVSTSYPYPKELISTLAGMGIVVHVEMEQMDIEEWQHQTIQRVSGTTVRTLSMTLATPFQRTMKRTLDIIGGIVGCILTGILALIIGPMIYIKSPGPIFFTQTRVGKNGRKFKIYKFRSMYMDAEARKAELMAQNRVQGGLMFKLEYDPRIIGCEKRPDGTIKKGIGNFIRDYSLDEFPQFFNVLKGELSLCGTRPPTVDEWEKYELHHRARLAIKPGITGLWQISGRSNITDFEQVVELDKKYIREWSMGLDFRILLQTIKVVLGKEGSM